MIMSNNRMVWWVYVVKAVTDISRRNLFLSLSYGYVAIMIIIIIITNENGNNDVLITNTIQRLRI